MILRSVSESISPTTPEMRRDRITAAVKKYIVKLGDDERDRLDALIQKAKAPARQVLRSIATEMVEFITSDFGTSVFRVCVGESERFPDLAREFYECGPMLIRGRMADFFHGAMERGDHRGAARGGSISVRGRPGRDGGVGQRAGMPAAIRGAGPDGVEARP